MGDFFEDLKKYLVLKHRPTQETPWGETEYLDEGGIDRFVEFVNKLSPPSHLALHQQSLFFRGQADSSWFLEPSFYRLVKKIPLSLEDALNTEFYAIRYFRQQAKNFLNPKIVPNDDEMGEWLVLMQQYGAPTRMLDWTTSYVVALYFAVIDEIDKPGALWFFGPYELDKAMRKFVDLNKTEVQDFLNDQEKYVRFGTKDARLKIYHHDSEIKPERIVAQQSVFTYCEQLFCNHAQVIGKALLNISTDEAEKNYLQKITIGPEVKRKMRIYLNKLNVTAATLFPGVEGIGRSISEIINVQRDILKISSAKTS